ncbi:hypothetical protein L9F63_008038, partial [Diploptera punctata]
LQFGPTRFQRFLTVWDVDFFIDCRMAAQEVVSLERSTTREFHQNLKIYEDIL